MSDDQVTAPSRCCSGTTPQTRHDDDRPSSGNLPAATGEATTCPVMPGAVVDTARAEAAGLFRDYRGRRHWFCCRRCGPRFDRDPEKYTGSA